MNRLSKEECKRRNLAPVELLEDFIDLNARADASVFSRYLMVASLMREQEEILFRFVRELDDEEREPFVARSNELEAKSKIFSRIVDMFDPRYETDKMLRQHADEKRAKSASGSTTFFAGKIDRR